MKAISVALRYCGGCNPRYDRCGLADSLQKQFPQIRFSPFCSGENYNAALVICGCPVQCAEQRDLPLRRFVLTAPTDLDCAADFLANTLHIADNT